jgi:TPR repeat protein
LGNCFLDGVGVEKSEKSAIEWFEKAGANGHARSLAQLGQIYSEKDQAKSYEYFLAAVRNGFTTDDI